MSRLTDQGVLDVFHSEQDEVADRANAQAREALRLALTLLAMAQVP